MSVQVEKLEKSMAKLTVEVSAQDFDAALDAAYRRRRGKISVPGFRKGKAPRAMIENLYGADVFYNDAADLTIPDAYESAVDDSGLEVVSQPEIEAVQIEKGKPFIFTATVAVKPEIVLGEYKGIEIEKMEAEVSDSEVEAEIERARNVNSRLITVDDRAAAEGDCVVIDFDGFIDGKPFEGGKAENYELTLGSHSFIDGFEEQIVGKNTGDEFDVNVTFPSDYQSEELAGRPAVFKVKLNEITIKELPDVDDDFAQDVSDFDTLDEYKEDLRKKLLESKEAELKREREEAVVKKIIENSQMDVPEPMIDTQTKQMIQEFADSIQRQGLAFEQYMKFTGLTMQKMSEDFRPQALLSIQSRLVLEAVVAAEGIEASDEEIEKEIEKMSQMYNTQVDKVKEMIDDEERKRIGMDVAVQKAVDLVMESHIEK